MAHGNEKRLKVRDCFINKGYSLAAAACEAGVGEATARTWKRRAKAGSDDWELEREAVRMARGGLGDMTSEMLREFAIVYKQTMKNLRESTSIKPEDVATAMAKLSDAMAKMLKAAGMADPRLGKLAIALEVLEMLSKHICDSHPKIAQEFAVALEEFGSILSSVWQ